MNSCVFSNPLDIEFHRFTGKAVRDLLGVYIGIDGHVMCGLGAYAAMAVNLRGACLSQFEIKGKTDFLQGLIGVGVAIPIFNIRPDYSVIGKSNRLRNALLAVPRLPD